MVRHASTRNVKINYCASSEAYTDVHREHRLMLRTGSITAFA